MRNMKRVEPVVKQNKYRYACQACTNVAFYSDVKEVEGSRVCMSCGKTIELKKENYIKL